MELEEQSVYFKCTACSECFMSEDIFFAHTRTWHCKILICVGQNAQKSVEHWEYNVKEEDFQHLKDNTQEWEEHEFGNTAESFEMFDESVNVNENANNSIMHQTITDVGETELSPTNTLACVSSCSDLLSSNATFAERNLDQIPRSTCIENENTGYFSSVDSSSYDSAVMKWQQLRSMTTADFSNKNSRSANAKKIVRRSKAYLSNSKRQNRRPCMSENLKCNDPPTELMSKLSNKRWGCSMCFYHTVTRADMEKHIRIHTGEKPFQCLHCSRSFSQKTSLNRHLQALHKLSC